MSPDKRGALAQADVPFLHQQPKMWVDARGRAEESLTRVSLAENTAPFLSSLLLMIFAEIAAPARAVRNSGETFNLSGEVNSDTSSMGRTVRAELGARGMVGAILHPPQIFR